MVILTLFGAEKSSSFLRLSGKIGAEKSSSFLRLSGKIGAEKLRECVYTFRLLGAMLIT
ncbi:hypothetical protein AGMMS49949_05690 [Alphaproteobacteria bacterium]|nr:hypothetical protein AGMMS49949_05690 [Alphaproteobacteria bacterium]GHS97682.1 hypothetical protein AGMMS50296_4860 [Alphaproteobacteria bacterium]